MRRKAWALMRKIMMINGEDGCSFDHMQDGVWREISKDIKGENYTNMNERGEDKGQLHESVQ